MIEGQGNSGRSIPPSWTPSSNFSLFLVACVVSILILFRESSIDTKASVISSSYSKSDSGSWKPTAWKPPGEAFVPPSPSAAASSQTEVLQGLCTVNTGEFTLIGERNDRPRAAAAATTTKTDSSTLSDEIMRLETVEDLLRAMSQPQWSLELSDNVRRQYDILAMRRQRSSIQQSGFNPSNNVPRSSSSSSVLYRPLSLLDEMSFENLASEATTSAEALKHQEGADAARVWSWPFTELWPMPSFVSTGDSTLHQNVRNDVSTKASSFLISGNRRNRIDVEIAKTFNAPIYGDLKLDSNSLFHSKDPLRNNKSAPLRNVFIPPQFGFSFTEATLAMLTTSEINLLLSAFIETCSGLHLQWAGRVREAAGATFGRRRDSLGCDIGADHDRSVKNRAVQNTENDKEDDLVDVSHPRGLLLSLVIDVERSDKESLFWDGGVFPHFLADEAYSLTVEENKKIERRSFIEQTEFHGLKAIDIETPDDDSMTLSSPPVSQINSKVRAHSLWGVLHGLESFLQVSEGFGVAGSAKVLSKEADVFDSPTSLILQAALGEEIRELKGWPHIMRSAAAVARVAATNVATPCSGAPSDAEILSKGEDRAAPSAATLPLLILDQPWRPWRGFSIDTSRHWIPLASMLELIDGLAMSRLNVLHWHFADAQSFPLLLPSHPELAIKGAWDIERIYTPLDVQRIVEHAASRGVRVVPELDMPAHVHSWSLSHPELLVHCKSVGSSVKELDLYALDPTIEETYTLIKDMFQDLSNLFPDKYLHIGADEVAPECWASEPRILLWAKENLQHLYASIGPGGKSLSDAHKAYAVLLTHFVTRVTDIVISFEKKPVSWEDSFEKVHEASPFTRLRRALALASSRKDGVSSRILQTLEEGDNSSRRLNQNKTLTTSATVDKSLSMTYPKKISIQGWKCWVQHADEVVLKSIESNMREDQGVLQSSCWYLDYSSTWADYYRHWHLPETPLGLHRLAENLLLRNEYMTDDDIYFPESTSYPLVLFSKRSPYWGGEAAMWTERVDASNLACRAWPRAAVTGELLWSESLAYDRFSRYYSGKELPFKDSNEAKTSTLKTSPADALESLFAAPRLLTHNRRILRRGIAAASLSVFDIAPDTHPGTTSVPETPKPFLAPQSVIFEKDQIVFNGMCPGIEQSQQRNASRSNSLATGPEEGRHGQASPLTFATYNLHEGGGANARLSSLLGKMRKMDVDVLAIIEANDWDSPPPTNVGRLLSTIPIEALELGKDEKMYQTGRSLLGLDTSAHVKSQTAGFKRRAAAAGYAFSHMLHIKSGYHLAILSSRGPLVVVLEDTEHFERGLLVADVAGTRFLVAHLHAQDSHVRLQEAKWIAKLVARYTAAGIPLVLLGDLNSLSPQDASCLSEEGTIRELLKDSVPAYLREKYLCTIPSTDKAVEATFEQEECKHQAQQIGNSTFGSYAIDFRPVMALLANSTLDTLSISSPGLIDLALLPPTISDCYNRFSFPTSALGQNADDAGNDNGHIPLRLDFALANALLLRLRPNLRCSLANPHEAHILELSDHLPLICGNIR
jgi:endonuclease/exonuclease/phosphatase family metal-dependent hydrolase